MPRGVTRTPEPHEIVTTEGLAAWLHVSQRTVERMGFPSVAPGRYLFAHVLDRCEELRRERARGLTMGVSVPNLGTPLAKAS